MSPAPRRVVTAAGQDALPWTAAIARLPVTDPLALLGLASGDRVVVVVPHPDDETLALGGTLRRLSMAGVVVDLLVATDGEASYAPDGPDPAALGTTRRGELDEALARLDVVAAVTRLGLPDGRLADHEAELRAAVVQMIGSPLSRPSTTAFAADRTVLLAPWEHDPHPDHRAAGRAALSAARATRTDCWAYPVWLRHAHPPGSVEVPWERLRRVSLDAAAQAAKRAAVSSYRSQVIAPSEQIEAVLPDHVLAHFADGHELLVSTAPDREQAATHFDMAYAAVEDPWSARTSRYERRKRDVLLSGLPRERYANGWEPGCSLGVLTVELARRCEHLEASDVSARAVAAARRATQALDSVAVTCARLPDDPPPYGPGECDLVVLSEVLYYLAAADRRAVLALARRLLAPGGHLVVMHWRGHPYDAHCSGEQANEEATTVGRHLVHHVDERFVLDVFESTR